MDLKPPFKYLIIKSNTNIDKVFLEDFFKGLVGKRVIIEYKDNCLVILHNYIDDLNIEEAVVSLNSEMYFDVWVYSSKICNSEKEFNDNYNLIIKSFKKINSEERFIGEKSLTKNNVLVSVNEDIKKLVLGRYYEDEEMIKILKMFFECNMNSTKAANNLYMHRNTLLNKLDKFIEVTGYDIKKFEDAMTIYLIINN